MVVSDRYHRQRLVSGIGDNGQVAITQSTIVIVGVGALGCMSASMLARAGVGHVILIDRDIVETTNLQRQILFTEEDARVQRPKAIAAAKHLAIVNSDITITAHVEDVTPHNIDRLLQNVDVIVDGLDNFETRYLLNDYAVQTNTPYMFAGAIAGHGNVMTIIQMKPPVCNAFFLILRQVQNKKPATVRVFCRQRLALQHLAKQWTCLNFLLETKIKFLARSSRLICGIQKVADLP